MFLLAGLCFSDRRRMSHAVRDPEFVEQLQNHPIEPVASSPTTTGAGKAA